MLQFCASNSLINESKIVNEAYERMHTLLNEEERILKEKGLNPHDYLPLPEYLPNHMYNINSDSYDHDKLFNYNINTLKEIINEHTKHASR